MINMKFSFQNKGAVDPKHTRQSLIVIITEVEVERTACYA